jgi:hypothetical protein
VPSHYVISCRKLLTLGQQSPQGQETVTSCCEAFWGSSMVDPVVTHPLRATVSSLMTAMLSSGSALGLCPLVVSCYELCDVGTINHRQLSNEVFFVVGCFLVLVLFCGGSEFELRASHLLGRCSTT